MTDSSPAVGEAPLQKTPFHPFHVQHGGRLVPFAGWEMPIRYGSIIDEHHQVRRSGGLFDVSHMGRIRFTGKDACRLLDRLCTRQIHGMQDAQCRYSLVCNTRGGCRDDVLIYRFGQTDYLMVCNAANRAKLLAHIEEIRGDFVFKQKDETESTAMVAIQGPKVMEVISAFSSEIPTLKRYRFTVKNLLIARVIVSRTGYTGEDGVEVILPAMFAGRGLDMIMQKVGGMEGEEAPIKPIGLGARDSLRLEAGMPLYGHELTEEIDPLSAGLGFAVKLDKGDDDPEVERFVGQEALRRIAEEGTPRALIGLKLDGKRTARQEMAVLAGGRTVGVVTSGCWSPTLEASIAMAYLDRDLAEPGSKVEVDLGKSPVAAEVCALPFYKAPK